jgi:hypothetical protein
MNSESDHNRMASSELLQNSRVKKWLLVLAMVVLCAIPFFRSYQLRERPMDEDEIYWIGQTYYYHLAFETGDWSHPDWTLLPARENPALGKYVLGVGLKWNGVTVTNLDWLGIYYHIILKAWGRGHDYAERQAVLDRMQPDIREAAVNHDHFEYPAGYPIAARSVMVVFGMISVVTVFVLTSLYTNRTVAFGVAVLFALHPAVVMAYTAVGADILALAFSLLTVLHFVLIQRAVWRRYSRPRLCQVLLCAGGGLCLALAVGSKLNSAVVGFVGALVGLHFLWQGFRQRSVVAKQSFLVMAILLAGSFILFVASNPVDYPNPLAGLRATWFDPQHSLELQRAVLLDPPPPQSWGDRLAALATLTAWHWTGFGLMIAAFIFDVICAGRRGTMPSVIALWWFLAVLFVSHWLPFARPRYALPVIAPGLVLLGLAIDNLLKRVGHRKSSANAKPDKAVGVAP